jgi:hypothetical protein
MRLHSLAAGHPAKQPQIESEIRRLATRRQAWADANSDSSRFFAQPSRNLGAQQ